MTDQAEAWKNVLEAADDAAATIDRLRRVAREGARVGDGDGTDRPDVLRVETTVLVEDWTPTREQPRLGGDQDDPDARIEIGTGWSRVEIESLVTPGPWAGEKSHALLQLLPVREPGPARKWWDHNVICWAFARRPNRLVIVQGNEQTGREKTEGRLPLPGGATGISAAVSFAPDAQPTVEIGPAESPYVVAAAGNEIGIPEVVIGQIGADPERDPSVELAFGWHYKITMRRWR